METIIKKLALYTLLVFLVIMVVFTYRDYVIQNNNQKDKAKDMNEIENNFESGCTAFAQHHCSNLVEESRINCYNDALTFCPYQGVLFRKWIEDGRR